MLYIKYAHLCHRKSFSVFSPFTYWYIYVPPFFQCICSLLHINKIFEVGISEHLAIKLQHMNIDLIGKVSVSKGEPSVPPIQYWNLDKFHVFIVSFSSSCILYVFRQILPLQQSWITCQTWSVQNLVRFHFDLEILRPFICMLDWKKCTKVLMGTINGLTAKLLKHHLFFLSGGVMTKSSPALSLEIYVISYLVLCQWYMHHYTLYMMNFYSVIFGYC